MNLYFLLFLKLSLLSLIRTESCNLFKSCGQCIGHDLRCVWCPDETYNGTRCMSSVENFNGTCSKPYNPKTMEPLFPPEKNDKTAPLQPQYVSIKARPGDRVHFQLTYKPKKMYPLDVYYLFDNSYTMITYKDMLAKQAEQLYKGLKTVSDNVKFGAGSFVEKLALPYASKSVGHKLNTFNNHLSLTDDISEFGNIVKKTNHTGNYDDPEAGLDGLMQAMVCDEIGWRKEQSKKIIIFLTDERYHSAGDGKAVGAYLRNDMKCYLKATPNGEVSLHHYDPEKALLYDYPSVSQINKVASERKIGIFFAATANVRREYEALAEAIRGSKYVELKNDKSNTYLVDLLVWEYKNLSQKLEIPPLNVPPHLDVTLDPACLRNQAPCSIEYNGSITINVTLQVKSCPNGKTFKDKIKIKPVLIEDEVTIEVEGFCRCECEDTGIKNSSNCNKHGSYGCGVCDCNKDWYGKSCECPGSSTEEEDLRKCKTSANATEVCNGQSKCICGKCGTCWNGYAGDKCQILETKCPTHDEKECGDNGKCESNKCKCYPGWTGNDCMCSTDKNPCIGFNGKECSGNGKCKCSVCECSEGSKYSGRFCDQCDTCSDERCKRLKDYVMCIYEGKEQSVKAKCDEKFQLHNTNIIVEYKDQSEMNKLTEGYSCKKTLKDESSILFKYLDGNNKTTIWIQKEKEFPPVTNIWISTGSAVGAVLLIGILTLIAWKVLVDMHDAREYRKFEKEANEQGLLSMNPLYRDPGVNFNNPAYNEQD